MKRKTRSSCLNCLVEEKIVMVVVERKLVGNTEIMVDSVGDM